MLDNGFQGTRKCKKKPPMQETLTPETPRNIGGELKKDRSLRLSPFFIPLRLFQNPGWVLKKI